MKYSILSIKNLNHQFDDAQKLLDKLISDVTLDTWEAVTTHLLEQEYDGTILHTYPVFNKETSELSQVFAIEDLTKFEERVYNYSTVKDLFVVAREKSWLIRIENS
jgi:hypothetical protein